MYISFVILQKHTKLYRYIRPCYNKRYGSLTLLKYILPFNTILFFSSDKRYLRTVSGQRRFTFSIKHKENQAWVSDGLMDIFSSQNYNVRGNKCFMNSKRRKFEVQWLVVVSRTLGPCRWLSIFLVNAFAKTVSVLH